jgi:lipoprotein-releasing system permease protein
MKLPVNLKIVKVHMLSRRRQTIVAMMGVTFGIGMFILMMSFMKGMNDFFRKYYAVSYAGYQDL